MISDGEILAEILCIIDNNPSPSLLFGAPAISISQLENSLNLSTASLEPDRILRIIQPLSETLFDIPRYAQLKEIKRGDSIQHWVVFTPIETRPKPVTISSPPIAKVSIPSRKASLGDRLKAVAAVKQSLSGNPDEPEISRIQRVGIDGPALIMSEEVSEKKRTFGSWSNSLFSTSLPTLASRDNLQSSPKSNDKLFQPLMERHSLPKEQVPKEIARHSRDVTQFKIQRPTTAMDRGMSSMSSSGNEQDETSDSEGAFDLQDLLDQSTSSSSPTSPLRASNIYLKSPIAHSPPLSPVESKNVKPPPSFNHTSTSVIPLEKPVKENMKPIPETQSDVVEEEYFSFRPPALSPISSPPIDSEYEDLSLTPPHPSSSNTFTVKDQDGQKEELVNVPLENDVLVEVEEDGEDYFSFVPPNLTSDPLSPEGSSTSLGHYSDPPPAVFEQESHDSSLGTTQENVNIHRASSVTDSSRKFPLEVDLDFRPPKTEFEVNSTPKKRSIAIPTPPSTLKFSPVPDRTATPAQEPSPTVQLPLMNHGQVQVQDTDSSPNSLTEEGKEKREKTEEKEEDEEEEEVFMILDLDRGVQLPLSESASALPTNPQDSAGTTQAFHSHSDFPFHPQSAQGDKRVKSMPDNDSSSKSGLYLTINPLHDPSSQIDVTHKPSLTLEDPSSPHGQDEKNITLGQREDKEDMLVRVKSPTDHQSSFYRRSEGEMKFGQDQEDVLSDKSSQSDNPFSYDLSRFGSPTSSTSTSSITSPNSPKSPRSRIYTSGIDSPSSTYAKDHGRTVGSVPSLLNIGRGEPPFYHSSRLTVTEDKSSPAPSFSNLDLNADRIVRVIQPQIIEDPNWTKHHRKMTKDSLTKRDGNGNTEEGGVHGLTPHSSSFHGGQVEEENQGFESLSEEDRQSMFQHHKREHVPESGEIWVDQIENRQVHDDDDEPELQDEESDEAELYDKEQYENNDWEQDQYQDDPLNEEPAHKGFLQDQLIYSNDLHNNIDPASNYTYPEQPQLSPGSVYENSESLYSDHGSEGRDNFLADQGYFTEGFSQIDLDVDGKDELDQEDELNPKDELTPKDELNLKDELNQEDQLVQSEDKPVSSEPSLVDKDLRVINKVDTGETVIDQGLDNEEESLDSKSVEITKRSVDVNDQEDQSSEEKSLRKHERRKQEEIFTNLPFKPYLPSTLRSHLSNHTSLVVYELTGLIILILFLLPS
ncbi:hypothetical protein TREMEDRAFT_64343 [Tremella mesenterica DSM 1558]|uniref:uncharacterized protein n=1 Tax=Tremella mesenterica (strain ATCC 24925 / CBS 8224 / DSM 1558 / NBRC 9311 / NRRL Y-6157 / RJB 2259-6 / UBC 559-6) TaxID=578456 RepID=UPI0003F48FDF|nr:uncharacterized protein TREMEDRAFT_64343 [Tremella mesenterica DSM 1558]EIW67751.1 hypothetical protein TREMEDRAFT_64343 [Tremella mesenterica DSM 1558]